MHHKKDSYLGLSLLLSIFSLLKKRGERRAGKNQGSSYDRQFPTSGGETYLFAKNSLVLSFCSSGARNCEWGKATTISYLPAKSFSALDRQGKEGGRGIMQAPAEALPCPVGPSTNVNSGGCTKKFVGRALLLLFLPFARGLLPPSLPPCPSTFFVCIFLLPPFFAVGSKIRQCFSTERFPYFTLAKKHDSFCCALFSHLKTFVKFLIPSRAFRSPSSSLATAGGPSSFLPAALKRGRDDSERTRDEKRGENVPPFFPRATPHSLTGPGERPTNRPTEGSLASL